MYASGFLSAHVLVGNHEHEKMFQGKHGLDFIVIFIFNVIIV